MPACHSRIDVNSTARDGNREAPACNLSLQRFWDTPTKEGGIPRLSFSWQLRLAEKVAIRVSQRKAQSLDFD
jgi:hypothetical protein